MNVLVIGGRGFVGKAVCAELKKRKHAVFTFDQHQGRKNHFQGSILSLPDLEKALEGMDIIINLVGLTPVKKQEPGLYEKIHVEGVKNIIEACKKAKIKRFVHMSALGADKNSDIEYLRTKGLGEEAVLHSGLNVTVFCPSLIFDTEHELIQQAVKMAPMRSFPEITAKVQPIFRGDLAKLFALAVEGKIKEKKLEVGGPQVMMLFEMVEKIYAKKGYPCVTVPLSLVKVGLGVASLFGLFGISKDQIKSLDRDNITKSNIAE